MPAKASKSAVKASAAAAKTDEDSLIGGHVSVAQAEKACAALAAHRLKNRKSGEDGVLPLDGDDEEDIDEGEGARSDPSDVVWMQITIKMLRPHAPPKPIRLPVPHPIFAKSSSVCLLSADPQRTYKDLMVSERITQVKRVVGVTKLKGKFAPYEARRQLMNDHDLFLADDRIVPMLPKLLGKKWMEDRRTPIPVQLTKTKDGRVRKSIEAALASTFFHRNKGTCASVRLGTVRHLSASQLAENMAAALPVIVSKHINGGWTNVQSIDIKTGTSAALPVWNCNLSERWAGLPEQGAAKKDTEQSSTAADATPGKGAKKTTKSAAKETASRDASKTRSSTSKQRVQPKAKKA